MRTICVLYHVQLKKKRVVTAKPAAAAGAEKVKVVQPSVADAKAKQKALAVSKRT